MPNNTITIRRNIQTTNKLLGVRLTTGLTRLPTRYPYPYPQL